MTESVVGRRLLFGLNTFGDVASDDGRTLDDAQSARLLVEDAQLAEAAGLDVFSVGEHYREGQVDSATPVLLAAAAQATSRIRVGTSATDSFGLFGFDITEYEALFEEKLELFMRLMREDRVTWSGRFRPALDDVRLHPRMPAGGIPAWIGIGGSPDSVMRAARFGLPLMMAVIGGKPERFAGHTELYLRALDQYGHPELPIAQHSLGFIAETDEQARELHWRYWEPVVTQIGRERGFYPPTRKRYLQELDEGALYVGGVETVAQKIARTVRTNHLSRFDLKYDVRHLPRQAREESVRLFGERVAPRVRELLEDNDDTWRPTGREPAQITADGGPARAR